MAKAALTILDLVLILLLMILGLREFLAFQIGLSRFLPNSGELIGFDAAKLLVIGLCAWGIWYFMKRI